MSFLFSIKFAELNYLDYINNSLKIEGYSCFVNSHMVYEQYNNPSFFGVLKESSFNLPDGMPLVYSLRFIIKRKQERIAGNDVIFDLMDKASENDLRVFIIGTTNEVLNKISKKLEKKNIIHKVYSPPFTSIDKFDYDFQVELINDFNPDITMVGLGCPKQEIWMSKMNGKIKGHMYGLGGALLLYAGIDSRAPKLIRDLGLEWTFRLLLEPRRLFRRYLITNLFFIWKFILEFLKVLFLQNKY